MPALSYALCLLARTCFVGIVLFLLPPTGEQPPYWQIGLAFLGWVGWCYRRGLLAQRDVTAAVVESIPSILMSLMWVQLLLTVGKLE